MQIRLKVMAAATAVALASVTGCGVGGGTKSSGSQPTVSASGKLKGTITFQTWSLKNDKFTPYFNQLIAAFQKQHPGTTVKWIDQPGDGYADKVTSQVTSKSLPDVINLPPDIAYSVVKAGSLLDLSKNVPDLKTTFNSGALDAYTYKDAGGGTYGFPWYLGTDVSYWNAAMMKRDGLDASKPPTTFDELVAQAKIMHDKSGGKDYLMSRAPGLNDFANAGVPLATADGKKFTFNTPAAAKVLDTYKKAYKAGYMPPDVLSNTYEGNSALFSKQKVAWTTGTGNFIQNQEQTNPTLAKQIVPSAALDTPPVYVQGLSVAAKSKNPSLALAFAEFAADNANQVAFIKLAQGFLPGTTAAAKDPSYTKSDGTPKGDAAVLAYQDLEKAKSFTPPSWTNAMNTYLSQQIALAMTGKESSKKALDNAVAKANQLLGQ